MGLFDGMMGNASEMIRKAQSARFATYGLD
ncbi:hypothetical protein SAMN05216225_102335 [Ornithinibacillus halophilus]|uniref:Uncharacterized protein n=1 Tax=Ornithinibacillus halophilus TaxID=930117 RepID=A0A1M5IDY9_9BACI|nr:hypothetical protein SAMN05216225_102335 [Ornithinibacillus halophilus]